MNKRFGNLIGRQCSGFVILLAGLLFFSLQATADDSSAPRRVQGRLDDMVLHVDKYGVYVPNHVFYWDSSLPKQKIDALIRAAERLRNKRATIIYSAQEDLNRDRRPLVADIGPLKEEGPASGSLPSQEVRPSRDEPDASSRQASHSPDAAARSPRQEPTANEAPAPLTDPVQQLLFPRKEEKPGKTSPAAPALTRDQVRTFVQHLLALNERKDLGAILPYYADQVDYYDRGVVNRDHIRRDMGYYFRNWDSIRSTLDGDVTIIVTDEPDVRIVKYVSSYTVENSKKALSGKTENIWKIRKVGEGLQIIDVKQRKLAGEAR